MSDSPELKTGLKGTAELVVTEQYTALAMGSGGANVLATPAMILLVEMAAVAAVEKQLPQGQQSLGTRLDVRHIAATPIGMRVRAEAELVRVEGRVLTFRVSAADEVDTIADGTHERTIVTSERFLQGVQKKAAMVA